MRQINAPPQQKQNKTQLVIQLVLCFIVTKGIFDVKYLIWSSVELL